jgi:hypothetical protein
MTAKPTPGEWRMVRSRLLTYFTIVSGAQEIADVWNKLSMPGETEANARLMTASKPLLAALERLYNCPAINMDDLEPEDHAAMDQAREAIRAATREEPRCVADVVTIDAAAFTPCDYTPTVTWADTKPAADTKETGK